MIRITCLYIFLYLNIHLYEQNYIKTYLFLKAKMDLKHIILRKLYRRRVIGGKHTAVEHLTKGLPRHLAGAAKNAVKELVKEGFILTKSTSYGLQVSLNPEKIDEITKIIEE